MRIFSKAITAYILKMLTTLEISNSEQLTNSTLLSHIYTAKKNRI